MKIEAQTIPLENMRYKAVGDYWKDGNGWHFRIAEMGNDTSEWIVLIHEIVEHFLCETLGITNGQIDNFDFKSKTNEPGDTFNFPYRDEHCIATAVERMLCGYLRIPWVEYAQTLKIIADKKRIISKKS